MCGGGGGVRKKLLPEKLCCHISFSLSASIHVSVNMNPARASLMNFINSVNIEVVTLVYERGIIKCYLTKL